MNRLRPMRSDGPRHAHALPWRFAGPLLLLVAALVAPRTSAAQMLPSDDPPPTRPPSRVVARESAEVVAGAHADEAGFLSTVPMQIGGARGQTVGTGRRIDIDLRDADIHNVLRLLAEVGNVNIVTSDDVAGNVTIRMHNVPWDRALVVPGRPPAGGAAPEGTLDGRKLGAGPPTPGMGIPSAEPTDGGGCAWVLETPCDAIATERSTTWAFGFNGSSRSKTTSAGISASAPSGVLRRRAGEMRATRQCTA